VAGFEESIKMRMTVLASGSSGNACVLSNGSDSIMIDAGLPRRTLLRLMHKAKIDPGTLRMCILTHSHVHDHAQGADAIASELRIPVIASRGTLEDLTWSEASDVRVIPQDQCFQTPICDVERIEVSHDAPDSSGFLFKWGSHRLAWLTDLGVADGDVLRILSESDYAFIETAYDEQMLRECQHTAVVKARIVSDTGHLSTREAIGALCQADGDYRRVICGHLSLAANKPELVREESKRLSCQVDIIPFGCGLEVEL
jgi:phosphoribosyl 1,2-cyclic phosphodiesterase